MSATRFSTTFATAIAAALATACLTMPVSAEPTVKFMEVRNARIPYVEEGSGPPVVFVHGAVSDYRTWNPHRAALAKEGFRAISYTQRYFGSESWEKTGPEFSGNTHSADLAAFIRGLGAGPVHVVAWSYSGQIAFSVALSNPDLVKSAFIFEPADPTYVTDPSLLKLIEEDAGTTFGPMVKALKEGNNAEAVRQLISAVGGSPGYFAAQPAAVQSVQLDSAPSLPLQLNAPPAIPISCPQLGSIKTPTAVVWGLDTRPYFKIIAEEATRCMPAATRVTIQGANHMWPGAEPAKFTSALVRFLSSQ